MTIHLHTLKGCSPTPLASYLKALGILRLVGEQSDAQARGWWEGDRFYMLTRLSKEEIETFFFEDYEPTPIFNPWGGRSGYYPGSSEKTARNALTAVENSKTDRLSRFRGAIGLIRTVIEESGGTKPDDEDAKAAVITQIRLHLRGEGLNWLDTVIADLGDSFRGPAIFGTGGNEGSGSYTAAFLAAVVECLLGQSWNAAISTSLWSCSSDRDSWDGGFQPPAIEGAKKPKKETVAGPFRQFMPSGEGSPWDLLLAFEGAIVVQSGLARRSSGDQHRFLTSPFYFASLGMGAGSSSEMDEFVLNKGSKNPGRGEQWFPLWENPSTFPEVQGLFREGRCSARRRTAKNPLDAARAICGLGVARGITSFLRYGYLQRDNLATHFAVPLGRIKVNASSTARLADDLSGWLDHLHRSARSKNAPARLVQAERRLENAIFDALTHDHTTSRWQLVLLAAANIESMQATGTAVEAGPIPALRPDWVMELADGSAEFRLALALGSAAASYFKNGSRDPVRHHLLPLEDNNPRRLKTSDKRLVNDPRVVAFGRDPIRDLAAIIERRLIEAGMQGERRSRLVAAPGCGAHLQDLSQFLRGELDVDRVFGLARAFMAIRWDRWPREYLAETVPTRETPDECWLALRLACLPWPLSGDTNLPADPRIVRLLLSGNATAAIEIARQRLRSAGIRPPMYFGTLDSQSARRWAAALVFPIHQRTAHNAATILDPSMKGLSHA